VAWDWLRTDPNIEQHAVPLMSNIRFALVGPSDLVDRVQAIESMTRCPELRDMVFAALNYHVVPHAQPLRQSVATTPRACVERLVSVGGREIHPRPGLHDEIIVFGDDIATASALGGRRSEITTLPNPLSHMQASVHSAFFVCFSCFF
jgi:kelch-like protein 9/13